MKSQGNVTHTTGQARGIDFFLKSWFVAANASHHGASPWHQLKPHHYPPAQLSSVSLENPLAGTVVRYGRGYKTVSKFSNEARACPGRITFVASRLDLRVSCKTTEHLAADN